jgi:hypothetical protein
MIIPVCWIGILNEIRSLFAVELVYVFSSSVDRKCRATCSHMFVCIYSMEDQQYCLVNRNSIPC